MYTIFLLRKKKERKKLIIVKDIKDKHTRRYTILFLFFRPCEIHNYTRSIKREIEIEKNLISLKDIKDKQARKFSRARQLSPPVITARFPYFQPRKLNFQRGSLRVRLREEGGG